MLVSDFDYHLPEELIAQEPPPVRGASRLLVLERATGALTDAAITDLPGFLRPGDLLVVNDSRVFPARLRGRRVPSGGAVECFLVRRLDEVRWEALVHPGQKLRPGERFRCEGEGGALDGEILERHGFGRRTIALRPVHGGDVDAIVDAIGHVPLPPYIKRPDAPEDRDRYQTIFARERGSIAAPTAGLHFTPELVEALAARGVEKVHVTLHVGYGTFKPVRVDEVEAHTVDPEYWQLDETAARGIDEALSAGRRIVAVGTTTVRALESAAIEGNGRVRAGEGWTSLFIHPGFTFRVTGALLTNFHLPRSSLLMLVCAFAGRERVLDAYAHAVRERYRFYSYGDAMLMA